MNAGDLILVLFIGLWVALPIFIRRRRQDRFDQIWRRAGEIADAWVASYNEYLASCECRHCGARHDGKRKWLTETECWSCTFGDSPHPFDQGSRS